MSEESSPLVSPLKRNAPKSRANAVATSCPVEFLTGSLKEGTTLVTLIPTIDYPKVGPRLGVTVKIPN